MSARTHAQCRAGPRTACGRCRPDGAGPNDGGHNAHDPRAVLGGSRRDDFERDICRHAPIRRSVPGRNYDHRVRVRRHPELWLGEGRHRPEHQRQHHPCSGHRIRPAASCAQRVPDIRQDRAGVRSDPAGDEPHVPVRLRVGGIQRVRQHAVQRRVRVLHQRRQLRSRPGDRPAGLHQHDQRRQPVRHQPEEPRALPQQRPRRPGRHDRHAGGRAHGRAYLHNDRERGRDQPHQARDRGRVRRTARLLRLPQGGQLRLEQHHARAGDR